MSQHQIFLAVSKKVSRQPIIEGIHTLNEQILKRPCHSPKKESGTDPDSIRLNQYVQEKCQTSKFKDQTIGFSSQGESQSRSFSSPKKDLFLSGTPHFPLYGWTQQLLTAVFWVGLPCIFIDKASFIRYFPFQFLLERIDDGQD